MNLPVLTLATTARNDTTNCEQLLDAMCECDPFYTDRVKIIKIISMDGKTTHAASVIFAGIPKLKEHVDNGSFVLGMRQCEIQALVNSLSNILQGLSIYTMFIGAQLIFSKIYGAIELSMALVKHLNTTDFPLHDATLVNAILDGSFIHLNGSMTTALNSMPINSKGYSVKFLSRLNQNILMEAIMWMKYNDYTSDQIIIYALTHALRVSELDFNDIVVCNRITYLLDRCFDVEIYAKSASILADVAVAAV